MVEKPRRSLQELSSEVAQDPNSTAFVDLAIAYRERGDLERALRLCLRGLQRHPTHVEAHYALGRIYRDRGDRELALDEWRVVQQLAPEHVPAKVAAAELFLDEGRIEDARRELAEAKDLAPDDPRVEELRRRLETDGSRGPAPTEAAPRSTEPASGPSVATASPDDLGTLGDEHPGTLAVLVLDASGDVVESWSDPDGTRWGMEIGDHLAGARDEAERVASYLDLGRWATMVVESEEVRLSVAPAEAGTVIVATRPDVPAGRAARALRDAAARAADHVAEDG